MGVTKRGLFEPEAPHTCVFFEEEKREEMFSLFKMEQHTIVKV